MVKKCKKWYGRMVFSAAVLLASFCLLLAFPEPSMAATTAVTFGQTYSGQFDVGTPIYSVTVPATGEVTFTVQGSNKIQLTLISSMSQVRWIRKHEGGNGTYQAYLTGGTYLLYMSAQDSGRGNFKLRADFKKTNLTYPHSNNTLADAYGISMGQSITGQISSNDYEDVYKFRVSAGRLYLTFNTGNKTGSYHAYILDQKGREIYNMGVENGQKNFTIDLDLKGGVYYLKVTSVYYRMNEGIYTFKSKFVSAKETFGEPNNTLGQAPTASMNKTVYGHLAVDDNVDVYKMKIPKGNWSLNVAGNIYMTEIEILDTSGKKVWSVNDFNPHKVDSVEREYKVTLKEGTYYLRLKPKRYSTNGTYRFQLGKPKSKISIKKAKVSAISSRTYSGIAHKPSVTVKYGGKTLKKNVHYTLRYYNNVKPGRAYVAIFGNGSFAGQQNQSFVIVPKKVPIRNTISKSRKTATLTYAQSAGASGYQVVYSTKKNTGYRSSGYTKQSAYTITNLASGKSYYVKVRPYVTISGRKQYGKYSAPKIVRVK